jgi:hypothetical protein
MIAVAEALGFSTPSGFGPSATQIVAFEQATEVREPDIPPLTPLVTHVMPPSLLTRIP